jgi:hypothetical protein
MGHLHLQQLLYVQQQQQLAAANMLLYHPGGLLMTPQVEAGHCSPTCCHVDGPRWGKSCSDRHPCLLQSLPNQQQQTQLAAADGMLRAAWASVPVPPAVKTALHAALLCCAAPLQL